MFRINGDQLVYISSDDRVSRVVCNLQTTMGVVYDKEDGTLFKVLPLAEAEKWVENTKRVLNSTNDKFSFHVASCIEVEAFPITPCHIDEINACLQITGRVLKVAERFREIEMPTTRRFG